MKEKRERGMTLYMTCGRGFSANTNVSRMVNFKSCFRESENNF